MSNDIQKLAIAWLELQTLSKIAKESKHDEVLQEKVKQQKEELWWAYEKLDSFCDHSPDLAWDVITKMFESTEDEFLLSNIAAGPLEDLLVRHADEVIDRIEALAVKNPRFRDLLKGVWKNNISDEVWLRIQKL